MRDLLGFQGACIHIFSHVFRGFVRRPNIIVQLVDEEVSLVVPKKSSCEVSDWLDGAGGNSDEATSSPISNGSTPVFFASDLLLKVDPFSSDMILNSPVFTPITVIDNIKP